MTRNAWIMFAVVMLLAGGALGYYMGYDRGFETAVVGKIDSFERCIQAGHPMMKSLPPQCATPDGRVFVQGGGTMPPKDEQDGVACTLEARLCPDGSYVGRVPPRCEFASCPGGTPPIPIPPPPSANATLRGIVLLGPTCPVMRDPPDPQCADRPYQTQLELVSISATASRVDREFTSSADGRYSLSVVPGLYSIRSKASAATFPFCSTSTFTVRANETKEVTVQCDTGIR